MNQTTKTVLLIAVIAAAGGVAFWYYKKKQAEQSTVVTGVTSANPNGASNNTPALAQNINAATGAFNSLTNAFGIGGA